MVSPATPMLRSRPIMATEALHQVVVNGQSSKPAAGISGVTQCAVLGTMLFLLNIIDISEGVNSTMRLFADEYCIPGDTASGGPLNI